MKQSEIKELSTVELQEKLSDTKKTYVDLKMTHAISPSKIQSNYDQSDDL